MPGAELVEIVGPALAIGLMVAVVHAPMGMEVLARGIVFIDLAIAQIAGLYVILAKIWWHEPSWLMIQAAAALSAIVAAAFFRWVEQRVPREQEAVIGSAFVLAASAALLVLADHPRGGEEIQHILAGQILFVRWTEILTFAPVYAVAAGLWFGYPRVRRGFPFFLLFALVVTASVQLVGVYVVFASLILPALAVNAMDPPRPGVAISVGAAAVLAGIVGSTLADLPAGPVLVFAFAIAAVLYRVAHSMRSRASAG